MLPEERKQKVLELVCNNKSIKVSEISHLLDVSEVTARRDLDELDSQSKLKRTRGGAMAIYSVGLPIHTDTLKSRNIEGKKQIAALAYSCIQDNDTILVDSSSTVEELIKLIAVGDKKNLIIVTTSLVSLKTLSQQSQQNLHKVIAVSGEVNYAHDTFEGSLAVEFIRNIRADKSFMGVNGIEETYGFSTPRFEDAEIKKCMIESSIKSFILADSTKFGKSYLANVKAICDCVVTDCVQSGYRYEWLENQGSVMFASESVGTSK